MNWKLLWLIPALPLAGALLNGTVGKRLPRAVSGFFGCLGPFTAFALSVMVFIVVRGQGPLDQKLWTWMSAGTLSVDIGLHVDALAALMLLVVTGVGSLIHLYSIGYMHEDEGFARYFAYLNLFMFSMLVLVMADNLVLMFVGWEGVGLCSYLLIGFWFKDLKNADAGKKAFIVNRVGDFGFILGVLVLLGIGGTVAFAGMPGAIAGKSAAILAPAALLLFLGACGKSAQIPLYVWLPDAMAGPTPVSALIHAATMVTAGVYMIARLGFLFAAVPEVLNVIGAVGALTALMAAVIALAQTDIKKVLAYSTISQLGFMFAGMASAHFDTGIFHVVTHAFFKALLFLGAGAVIHALHGEQDIRKMGGLSKPLPVVFLTFVCGAVALAGLPGSSGFVSKDGILVAVYEQISRSNTFGLVWLALLATAFITAFYTARLIATVFWGARAEEEHEEGHEIHKPGLTMVIPLCVLAVLALAGGLLQPLQGEIRHPDAHAHHLNMWLSIGISVAGFTSGFLLFTVWRGWTARLVDSDAFRPLHRLVLNKFYVDEAYGKLVVLPLRVAAAGLWFVVDRLLIDTLMVHGAGWIATRAGAGLKTVHRGVIGATAAAIALGSAGMVGWLLYRVMHG